MYLEVWHIIILCCLFGFCAVYNRKKGVYQGIKTTLTSLHNEQIIEIKDGRIIPKISK